MFGLLLNPDSSGMTGPGNTRGVGVGRHGRGCTRVYKLTAVLKVLMLQHLFLDLAQAEEERRAAEEAARLAAEAAEGDPAVAQMRRLLNRTKSGAKVADAFKQLEVEGGLAGKWRVLYEVSFSHHPACQLQSLW